MIEQVSIMNEVLLTIFRGLVAFLLLLTVTRLVGRKAISQMTFFDFAVAITFGSLTANMAIGGNNSPLTAGIAIVTFGALAIITSVIVLKSRHFRKLVNSEPVIVIAKGELVKENMKKIRLTMEMLNTLLREKNAFNIIDVEYAILENDGKLSVLSKSNKQPVTPADKNIGKPYMGLTVELIIDGAPMYENMRMIGKDEQWIVNELHNMGIQSVKDVFFAAMDSSGKLYISLGITGKEIQGKYGIE